LWGLRRWTRALGVIRHHSNAEIPYCHTHSTSGPPYHWTNFKLDIKQPESPKLIEPIRSGSHPTLDAPSRAVGMLKCQFVATSDLGISIRSDQDTAAVGALSSF
jgi:hypothetical protein